MMATIVTMDSNVGGVVSARGFRSKEPELVHDNITFCLDGNQQSHRGVSHPPPDGNQHQSHYQPQRGSFLAMRKGLGSSERSRTDATTETTSSESTLGANTSSLLGGVLSSRGSDVAKQPPPYASNSQDSQSNESQVPGRTNTNISLQDLFIDDQNDNGHSRRDEFDHYSGALTPPGMTPPSLAPENLRANTSSTKKPLLNGASPPPMGTPPDSLYAQANLNGAGGREGEWETTTDNHLGLSISPVVPYRGDGSSPTSKASQPVLYSAIGSLENCSAHSLKSMWDNKQQPQKNGYASKFNAANLIAPLQGQNLLQPSAGEGVNPTGPGKDPLLYQAKAKAKPKPERKINQAISTSAKFGDSSGSKLFPPIRDGPPQPPPPTKQYQSAFQASFLKIQQKVDEAQNRKQRKTTPPPVKEEKTEANPAVAAEKQKSSKRSSMRTGRVGKKSANGSKNQQKSVKIDDASLQQKKKRSSKKKPTELFRPSCDAYTPRMERKKITYKPAEKRTPVQKIATTMGTLSRPNFRDALRRVAMLIRQHIVKIEQRFNSHAAGTRDGEGLFKMSMKEAFSEEKFATCRYKCTVVRVPMARPGMVFGLKKIRPKYEIPTEEEIYEFAHQLFKTVQLSSECSIVCLIYVERLMERSKVPLLASTWRPIFMCGLLLASKVWQDLSSWNIEFASVYPQFSLDAINKLELQFLRMVKWDLYISSSLYAKYYFALRSLVEKQDFRQRYNRMVGGVDSVAASEALKIQKRTEQVKEEALMQLSRSM